MDTMLSAAVVVHTEAAYTPCEVALRLAARMEPAQMEHVWLRDQNRSEFQTRSMREASLSTHRQL